MTSSIKPPGAPPVNPLGGVESTESAEKMSDSAAATPAETEAWKAKLGEVRELEGAEAPDSVVLQTDSMVEKLVTEALDASITQGLSPEERRELAMDLRVTLSTDPTLVSLSEEIHGDH